MLGEARLQSWQTLTLVVAKRRRITEQHDDESDDAGDDKLTEKVGPSKEAIGHFEEYSPSFSYCVFAIEP